MKKKKKKKKGKASKTLTLEMVGLPVRGNLSKIMRWMSCFMNVLKQVERHF